MAIEYSQLTNYSFLDDHNVVYDSRTPTEKLVDEAALKWNEFTKPYLTWDAKDLKKWAEANVKSAKNIAASSKDELVSNIASVWNESTAQTAEAYEDVSKWAYKHLSTDELKKILGNTKDDVKHSDLVKDAQKKWNSAKDSYLPDDSFFDKLSTKDLQQVLDSRDIPYAKKADRKELIKTVRRNLRYIYLNGEKKSADFYDSLQFDTKQLFDKVGHLRDNVFEDWSTEDLQSWLTYHGIIPKHHPENRKALIKAARKNSAALKEDVDSYIAYKSAHAQPFLSKATDTVADAAQTVSDTTFNLWSGSRLEQFLLSRGVSLPGTPTRDELQALAVKYKNKAADAWGSWSFDTWSTEDLQAWLKEHQQAAEGTRQDLVAAAVAYYQKAQAESQSQGQQVLNSLGRSYDQAKKHAFDTWNDSDLREYLASFGVANTKSWSHKDLVKSAEANYGIFAGKASEHSAEVKKQLATAYSTLSIYGSHAWYYLEVAGAKLKQWFYVVYRSTPDL